MNIMKLQNIKDKLDEIFNIKNIPPDMPFSQLIPSIYGESNIPVTDYLTKDFQINYHGLMFKNGDLVSKVYLTVFLSREVLDKIFAKNETDILIFSHHPMEMQTSDKGFIPLPKKYLCRMKERRLSVYVLHTPLDIHETISTFGAIARSLGLKNKTKYDKNSIGFSGVAGELELKISFDQFITKISSIFGIPEPHFVKKINQVIKVGVIPGGGSFVDAIKETVNLGCDTFLTGEFINKINNEYGKSQKEEVEEYIKGININLIECSHYATEKLVIINDIKKLFENMDLKCEFIEQDNAWY